MGAVEAPEVSPEAASHETDAARSPRRRLLVALWLVVFANGPLFFVARRFLDLPGTWEGPVLRPAIVVSIGVAVGLVLLDGERLDGRRLRPVPAVPFAAAVAFGVWAAITTLWSLEPEITLWRGLGYAGLPFLAWIIADLDADGWRSALGGAVAALVGGSVLAVVLRPEWGTDVNDDWRGLMTNRNGLGPICALGIFAGVALMAAGRRRAGAALVVLSGVTLLGTGSRTAWLAMLVAMGVSAVLVLGRRAYLQRPSRGVVAACGALLAGGVAVFVGAVSVLWNQSTFAQRRTIWELLGDHIADAPIIGTGWAAFWHHPELHTDPLLQRGSAHGAVPELLLGGGVVALGLWLVVVVAAVAGVGREMWRRPDVETWLWLAIVVFLLMENLTESFVLWFSYNWILLIAAALRFGGRRRGVLHSPAGWLDRLVDSTPAGEAMHDRAAQPTGEGSGVANR